mgnify:FL=1
MNELNPATCYDCGETVSKDAKTCLHCGANRPRKQLREGLHPVWTVLLVICALVLTGEAVVDIITPPNKFMYVHAELANLHESASTDAPVLMQLKKGHYLVVLENQGPWQSVAAHRTHGKTGWIQSSETGASDPGGNPAYLED